MHNNFNIVYAHNGQKTYKIIQDLVSFNPSYFEQLLLWTNRQGEGHGGTEHKDNMSGQVVLVRHWVDKSWITLPSIDWTPPLLTLSLFSSLWPWLYVTRWTGQITGITHYLTTSGVSVLPRYVVTHHGWCDNTAIISQTSPTRDGLPLSQQGQALTYTTIWIPDYRPQ